MYRSSPFRSTLNTGYITCLGMCKVCTEAVHSVALCPAKKAQTPKHGPGKKDRNRARGVFQGRRTSRSAGIYIYMYNYIYFQNIHIQYTYFFFQMAQLHLRGGFWKTPRWSDPGRIEKSIPSQGSQLHGRPHVSKDQDLGVEKWTNVSPSKGTILKG